MFTGFLATFYVFVIAKRLKFFQRIANTKTYGMVLTLLKFTLLWAVFVVGFSYVLMVADIKEFQILGPAHGVVFFCLFNVFMVVVNFSRCVLQFTMIAGAKQ